MILSPHLNKWADKVTVTGDKLQAHRTSEGDNLYSAVFSFGEV